MSPNTRLELGSTFISNRTMQSVPEIEFLAMYTSVTFGFNILDTV